MAATQENRSGPPQRRDDLRTPLYENRPRRTRRSKNSLGEESIRDGRPTTDDSVVEAMDEEPQYSWFA